MFTFHSLNALIMQENMRFLDELDKSIPNFDNTDDYRDEQRKVKRIQGVNFKFDYTDYVIKILLATFVKWYFNLDQINQTNRQYQVNQQYQKRQVQDTTPCCTIL